LLFYKAKRKGKFLYRNTPIAIFTNARVYHKGCFLFICKEDAAELIKVILLKGAISKEFVLEDSGKVGIRITHDEVGFMQYCELVPCETLPLKEWVDSLNASSGFVNLTDKFELIKEIGKGRFSVVWNCRDKSREYAVKVIEKSKLTVREYKLLSTELIMLKMLHHKNIVTFYSIYESDKYAYVLMEHVSGGELYEYLKKKTYFTEFEVCYIVYHLLLGLAYLHSVGIIHRDLKAENILIEVDKEKNMIVNAKIGDFGLACPCVETIFDSCGTPAYVAPEVIRRNGYNYLADMWSIGVITYLLYCFPFIS
jgi:serine/threonine protein kinase